MDNPLAVVPIATIFQAFNKLAQSCFSSDNVENGVLYLLDKFISANTATDVSITLKAHVVFEHLIPGLLNLNGKEWGTLLNKVERPFIMSSN